MSSNSQEDLVKVSETDYLEEDPAIRNQQYVCLSFLNPEEVIQDKESYFISDFLSQYVSRNDELMKGLEVLFPDKKDELRSIREQYNIFFDTEKVDTEYKAYKIQHESRISSKYLQENSLRNCVRGVKVRGSYETLREAQVRAEVLKRKDNNKHNIYIAQVGCWCPLSANPEEIDTEYNETQLNTLMREYNKNQEQSAHFFNDRKNDLMQRTQLHNEVIKEENAKLNDDNEDISALEANDPWVTKQTDDQNKNEDSTEPEPENTVA